MKQTIILSVISWVIIGCTVVGAGFVDLSPDENGDLYVTGPGLGLFHSTDGGLN